MTSFLAFLTQAVPNLISSNNVSGFHGGRDKIQMNISLCEVPLLLKTVPAFPVFMPTVPGAGWPPGARDRSAAPRRSILPPVPGPRGPGSRARSDTRSAPGSLPTNLRRKAADPAVKRQNNRSVLRRNNASRRS